MRVTCALEVDGREYRVQLDSDDSIPVNELIGMASSQIDLMVNVTRHHEQRKATLRQLADEFAPSRPPADMARPAQEQ